MSSRIEAAYQRSIAAFKNPMLDLLHGRYAPFVVAALSVVFTPDRPAVAVADAHAEIAAVLDQLRAAGYGEDGAERPIPTGSARDICRHWVRVGWLLPQIEDNTEVYRLSAHAVGALEVAGRAGGGRARVSQSRVRTLLEAVEHLAQAADPDVMTRIARLTTEIKDRQAEITRLEHGGAVQTVDDEQLLEEAENVLHLVRELPADFARVAESIKAMQRDVVTDLRQDVRPTGEVLREYLQRSQHVMDATPEGRAFAGAMRLIGDAERIDDLSNQLRTVLRQPFAAKMAERQRIELGAVGRRVELGVQDVLTAQHRASHVIATQVQTHDPMRDRQIDTLLRDVMVGLQGWMPTSRRNDHIEPLRGFPVADIGHLRQSLSDIRPPRPPAALAEGVEDVEFVDGDTRSWGGPYYQALEAHLAGFTEDADWVDLAVVFESITGEATRPVDLLGLLEIAHRHGITETEQISTVEAVRPDGTRRRFAFGSVSARVGGEDDGNE